MFKHLVFFKFDAAQESAKVKAMLDALPAKIDVIREFEVGIDVLRTERSFDMALISAFDSKEDYLAYDRHPEHQKVRAYIQTVRKGGHAVDYEI